MYRLSPVSAKSFLIPRLEGDGCLLAANQFLVFRSLSKMPKTMAGCDNWQFVLKMNCRSIMYIYKVFKVCMDSKLVIR